MNEKEWLILNYNIPKEQSRVRVSVWRKLKKCGSVSIAQSLWVLPNAYTHFLIFEDISKEIYDNNGTAYIANADFLNINNNEDVVALFNKARDEEYLEVIDKCEDFFLEMEKETEKKNYTFGELEENEEEYNKLCEWAKKVYARDFFNADLKEKTTQYINKGKILLDEFSNKVYEYNQN